MPDGDIYHPGVVRRFQKPYRMICEGRSDPRVTERVVLSAVKSEIQHHGDGALRHVRKLASAVEGAFLEAGFDVTRGCVLASSKVDRLRYAGGLPPRLADLIADASKSYLHAVRYGRMKDAGSAEELILRQVYRRYYRTAFEGPVETKSDHYGDADPAAVSDRLATLRPAVEETLSKWAHKALDDGTVMRLKLPRRPRTAEIGLDDNLL